MAQTQRTSADGAEDLTALLPSATVGRPTSAQPTAADLAIRLWLLDQALIHLSRTQAEVGLGGNIARSELRLEREAVIARLRELGEAQLRREER